MRKVKRYNMALLVLLGLCGVGLGASVVLLVLSFSDSNRFLSLGGLIIAIASIALTVTLPFLTIIRDNHYSKAKTMLDRFGMEVSFLSLSEFNKKYRKTQTNDPIYALHAELPYGVEEIKRKEIGYQFASLMQEVFASFGIIAYSESGDFILLTGKKEKEVIEAKERLEERLLSSSSIPTIRLVLATSKSGTLEERINGSLELSRVATSKYIDMPLYVVGEGKEKEEELNLEKEESFGRLSYFVYPFGEVEDRVSILSPLLYDPFRGDTSNKDLYHMTMVTHNSFELDKLEVERAFIFLCEENEIGRLMLRLSEDSSRNESFLSEIASRLEKKGIEKDRLILAYPSLSLIKKEVKYAVKKSKALGFKVGVYEYGGERIDTLAELGIEYASMKTELVRPSANKELLSSLVFALRGMNITVLIEKGKLGEEFSSLEAKEERRLLDKDEAILDEKKEEEA